MKRECKGKLGYSLLLALIVMQLSFGEPATAEGFFKNFMEDLSSGLKQAGKGLDSGTKAVKEAAEDIDTSQLKTMLSGSRVGFNTKAANVRSGPGTNNSKVGTIPIDTRMLVLSEQGKWYQVQADHNGSKLDGWIYAPLVRIDPNANTRGAQSLETLTYEGYSKEYLPVKSQLEKGNLKGVEKAYLEKEKKARETTKSELGFIEKMGLLHWWERGIASIDLGEERQAVEYLGYSERLLEERQRGSKIGGWFMDVVSFGAETVSGYEELGTYSGEGYERVLMLNYKSIAYLLQGSRRAYNVTRRAIDWQNMERKQFEKKRKEIEKDLERKQAKQQQAASKESNKLATDDIMSRYASLRVKAKTVPSAFVNPFGYYVAGMIQEYESYDDWSLRDNARISYKKALKLNPKSKVLKRAVKDMGKAAPSGSRLVHVIVADGFVPEKKTLTHKMTVNAGAGINFVIPIKLPIYDPVESRVNRIEVRTTGGKRLAVLSPVADVEALCLRQQKDMEPWLEMRATLAVAKSLGMRGLLFSVGGPLGLAALETVSQKIDETAAPDMRSWMSLPSTIQAARLRLRRGVSKLKIVTYDKAGRVLASKKVSINPNSHDFVYARSMDKTLITQSAKKTWLLASN